jgi:hypothetical protein
MAGGWQSSTARSGGVGQDRRPEARETPVVATLLIMDIRSTSHLT